MDFWLPSKHDDWYFLAGGGNDWLICGIRTKQSCLLTLLLTARIPSSPRIIGMPSRGR